MTRPAFNPNRRRFLTTGAAALAASPLLSAFGSSPFLNAAVAAEEIAKKPADARIWGILLHLGPNMWGDTERAYTPPTDKFDCDVALWEELSVKSAESGLNMLVIDIGEALQYKSHPELAIDGAWSVDRLRADLKRLRDLGIEPIPKLNFSTCHDFWLGKYERMVSTPEYYKVCADLIAEVAEIFDKPRFFHLGYDEENYPIQKTYDYVVIRQGELWKRDFLFFIEQVEKAGSRPWIWADYCWEHPEFLEWAPKSILMSNWYYGKDFDPKSNKVAQRYIDLDKAGFDQVPGASNWSNDENFGLTVDFCRKNLSEERLKGFLMAPWKFTFAKDRQHHLNAISQVKAAMY